MDTSEVTLPPTLEALVERLAKNTHDVWAEGRMAEGWTPGPKRNDRLKQHPGLVPYRRLKASEKEYDRATAREVLKVILKLGYKIVPPA